MHNFSIAKSFYVFDVNWHFYFQDIDVEAWVWEDFHRFDDLARFHFSVFYRTCISDCFIVSQDFKEEWNFFCRTFWTDAFDVGLFFLVEFVCTIHIIVEQEFHCICTLLFDAFSWPKVEAVWQTLGARSVIACFFICQQKPCFCIQDLSRWKSILRVQEHRRCEWSQFFSHQDLQFFHLSHCWFCILILSHETFQGTALVKSQGRDHTLFGAQFF